MLTFPIFNIHFFYYNHYAQFGNSVSTSFWNPINQYSFVPPSSDLSFNSQNVNPIVFQHVVNQSHPQFTYQNSNPPIASSSPSYSTHSPTISLTDLFINQILQNVSSLYQKILNEGIININLKNYFSLLFVLCLSHTIEV